jgi:hypothetical protein
MHTPFTCVYPAISQYLAEVPGHESRPRGRFPVTARGSVHGAAPARGTTQSPVFKPDFDGFNGLALSRWLRQALQRGPEVAATKTGLFHARLRHTTSFRVARLRTFSYFGDERSLSVSLLRYGYFMMMDPVARAAPRESVFRASTSKNRWRGRRATMTGSGEAGYYVQARRRTCCCEVHVADRSNLD